MVPALAVPIGAASLAFTGPAFASATACTVLTGNISGTPASSVSGCNDTANTGGSGTFPPGALSSPATVTWATGGTTTFTFKYKLVSAKKDKCPAGDNEVTLSGKVTGHTGVGSSVTGKIKASICYNSSSGALSLLPGTTFKF